METHLTLKLVNGIIAAPSSIYISPSQGKRKANCKAEREVNTKFKEDHGHGRHNVTLSQHENVLTAVTTAKFVWHLVASLVFPPSMQARQHLLLYEEQKVICRASYYDDVVYVLCSANHGHPASLDLD